MVPKYNATTQGSTITLLSFPYRPPHLSSSSLPWTSLPCWVDMECARINYIVIIISTFLRVCAFLHFNNKPRHRLSHHQPRCHFRAHKQTFEARLLQKEMRKNGPTTHKGKEGKAHDIDPIIRRVISVPQLSLKLGF